MLFNSIEFLVFLPVVFLAYWSLSGRLQAQNVLLLGASYFFYGWWDFRFLALIAASSVVDFVVGRQLEKSSSPTVRKLLLAASICTNLGILGFFKYFNFFVGSLQTASTLLGAEANLTTLEIVLPVGISFYTFQTMSYSIDVYRGRLSACQDVISFFAFVSFFPQLVAGPIERAQNLLPQLSNCREFDYSKAVSGMRQILTGLARKIVIADQCAPVVNEVFAGYQDYSGNMLLIAAVLFAVQIYCDFSGYSDIAIGTARLFGFELMQNFRTPYFANGLIDFWRRWHISLSTWFRDYVYIPLGGNRGGSLRTTLNILIVFIVSGLWHGARWNFVIWGLIHGVFFVLWKVIAESRPANSITASAQSRLFRGGQILATFAVVVFAWIFFRAESLAQATGYLEHMLISNFGNHPGQLLLLPKHLVLHAAFPYLAAFVILEIMARNREHLMELVESVKSGSLRWGIYMTLVYLVMWHCGAPQEFIYFAF